jgi:diguanylate cyclase (GGDEF)-like protein/PAS domain S-box-containing protein
VRKRREYFEYIVENINNSILITDKEHKIIYVNSCFLNTTGYTKDEVIGKTPAILKSGKMSKKFYQLLKTKLENGEIWQGEFINKDKNGKLFTEETTIIPIGINKVIEAYVAVKDDISQELKMEELAYCDALTKIKNRHFLKKDLKIKLSTAIKTKMAVDFMFIDLDGFKLINDTLGHDIGDLLLIDVANKLEKIVCNYSKKQLTVFRTGGDEFAILVIGNSLKDTISMSKNILDEIEQPLYLKNHRIKISSSIGIASFNRDIQTDEVSLLKYADIAMYKAKNSGKGCCVYFDKKLKSEVDRKNLIREALIDVIKNDEFHILYQSIHSLGNSKELVGFESFTRWFNKNIGTVSPIEIISIAEELNIAYDIGIYIFKKVCDEVLELKNLYSSLKYVSVNLSYSQIINNDSVDEFTKIVKERDIDPSSISFEITEKDLSKNPDKVLEVLKKMRDIGFRVELDDFGTGNSSINNLKDFPFTGVKIDKIFTHNLLKDEKEGEIIMAIYSLAKIFNLDVIAEGVESREQARFLDNLSIDYAQGYYFNEPKSLVEMITS